MALLFDPGYRSTWMFPRNIRQIHPWKMAMICQILNQMSLNETEWTQESQNEFSALLTQGNLKSQNSIRDSHSGGARTYASQLESLGLIYKQGKKVQFTLAGKSLVDFEEPLKVIQTQLLNYQYPSSYSLNQNVKINPGIKIKPFVFALKFLKDQEVKFLTQSEFVFLLSYGHNSQCYGFVKEKILLFRDKGGTKENLINFIDNPLKDLYTPRSQNKTDPTKMLIEALEVANTMKNYLVSSCLAFEDKADKKTYLSFEFDEIISKSILNDENFIAISKGNNESFLRAYGAWNKSKDITSNFERKKLSKGEAIISSQFFEFIGNKLVIDSAEEFITKMKSNFGFERELVEKIINPLIPKSLSFFESSYIELAKGGTATATAFEKATAELFENTFMVKALHTGSVHKKGVGGYSDILLSYSEINESGVADTKATSYYTLPSTDYAKMVSNYIPNFSQLPGTGTSKLGFIVYIAGGLGGEIHSKLVTLFKETGVPASAINAKNLIEIAQLKSIDKQVFWNKFKLNKVLTVSDFQV
jgi:hypothetical protein